MFTMVDLLAIPKIKRDLLSWIRETIHNRHECECDEVFDASTTFDLME